MDKQQAEVGENGYLPRYLVERLDGEEEWKQLTNCNTLDYALLIAEKGLLMLFGRAYRALDRKTGIYIALVTKCLAA